MNIKHALPIKGFTALLLGAVVLASSCKKDSSPELSTDSLTNNASESIMATGTVSSSSLLVNSTFEETDALSKWQSEQAFSSSITRASGTAKSGSFSAKFTINKSDPLVAGSYRAELKNVALPRFAERWYGFSTYLPSSFTADPVPESIFQWHNVPNFSSGEDWGLETSDGGIRQTPLHVQTINGRYVLVHSLSTVPDDYRSRVVVKKYDLGAYKTGVWTDWVLHMKFTYQNDGIIEVWKDGQLALTIKGQTYYNDESGPYLKFGLYKWGWANNESTVSQRTIYFDDFKIGDSNSSFNDVSPGSTGTTPTPTPTPEPAPTPTTPGSVIYAVNAGGSAYTAPSSGITYQADKNYTGGRTGATNSAIAGTLDDALYQSERIGNFGYAVPVSNGTYEVTLKFAEIFYDNVNARQFDILLEGNEAISNLNIHKVAGFLTAYDVVKTVTVTDGVLNIQSHTDIDNAKLSAFHIKSTSTTAEPTPITPAPTAPNSVVFAVNAGGSAYTAPSSGILYQADKNYSGGRTNKTSSAIGGTPDDALYQSERFGNFSYAIPVTNGTYELTFKFAEIHFNNANARQFDILVEGREVISNLNIHKLAGFESAYDLVKTVTVTDGILNIKSNSDIENAKLSAFHVVKK